MRCPTGSRSPGLPRAPRPRRRLPSCAAVPDGAAARRGPPVRRLPGSGGPEPGSTAKRRPRSRRGEQPDVLSRRAGFPLRRTARRPARLPLRRPARLPLSQPARFAQRMPARFAQRMPEATPPRPRCAGDRGAGRRGRRRASMLPQARRATRSGHRQRRSPPPLSSHPTLRRALPPRWPLPPGSRAGSPSRGLRPCPLPLPVRTPADRARRALHQPEATARRRRPVATHAAAQCWFGRAARNDQAKRPPRQCGRRRPWSPPPRPPANRIRRP